MHRFAIVLFASVALVTPSLRAQTQPGLQYKMTMKGNAGGFGEMPMPVITVTTAGLRARTDTDLDMPGVGARRMSSIIDLVAKKMFVVMHDEKFYMEQAVPNFMANVDTTAMSASFKVINSDTAASQHKVIEGRNARRVLMAGDFPLKNPLPMMNLKEGHKMIIVAEQWLNDDADLVAAYKQFGSAFASGMMPGADVLLKDGLKGFPLINTVMMVQVPTTKTYDAEAIVKAGEKAEGLLMSMTMVVSNIKIGPVDTTIFAIPNGYTKH